MKKDIMKKFSNTIWSAVFAVIAFVCYNFIPSLHYEGFLYAGFVLVGAAAAYLQEALTDKND